MLPPEQNVSHIKSGRFVIDLKHRLQLDELQKHNRWQDPNNASTMLNDSGINGWKTVTRFINKATEDTVDAKWKCSKLHGLQTQLLKLTEQTLQN